MNTRTTERDTAGATQELSATNPVQLPTNRTMSAREVCEVLGIGRATLYRHWDAGEGPRRVLVGRRYRVTPAALREYLLAAEVAA